VWHILREQLGWTCQRPARRAVERDEAAIAHWVNVRWPQLKMSTAPARADRLRRRVGVSLPPAVRATWSPRGHTPVLRQPLHVEAAVAGWRTRLRGRRQRRRT
jgi:hypothetical protein